MRPARQWNVLVLILGCSWAAGTPAADFALTPAEMQRVESRGIVVRAHLDASQRRGSVRAALRIDAPPEVVYQMMIRCDDALEYVPHLRRCKIRNQAKDDSWVEVEHEIDFGWYAPRVNWTFRADLTADRRIDFRQVRGDFKANEGAWELEPTPDGATTLLLYQAFIDPPGFVPNWLARSTFKRELPQMLADLRRRCEAEQTLRAQARTPARQSVNRAPLSID
jgi:uncharacterized membrane protein